MPTVDASYADEVIAALVRHVLAENGPATTPDIVKHAGIPELTRSEVNGVLYRNANHTFVRDDNEGRWDVVPTDQRTSALAILDGGSPSRPRICQCDGFRYAVLPPAAEELVRRYLAEHPYSTAAAAHAYLDGKGWRQVHVQHVLLYLAHFNEFRLTPEGWVTVAQEVEEAALRDWVALHWQPTREPASAAAQTRTASASRAPAEREVFITGKGEVYHWDPNCHLLKLGWAKAYGSGAHATRLQPQPISFALRAGYRSCRGCSGTG